MTGDRPGPLRAWRLPQQAMSPICSASNSLPTRGRNAKWSMKRIATSFRGLCFNPDADDLTVS